MNVSDAVEQRKSVRGFLDKPVSSETLITLIEKAARAPSGGNVQPWRIYAVNGDGMKRFQQHLANWEGREPPAYDIYPQNLSEPYRSSRFKCGEDMYALLGIPRDDKPARLTRLLENYKFFGAPAAIFCFVDDQMGPPQWSDLGMYLQTFMLLAEEAGLATCAQEIWATRPESVKAFVQAPASENIFCGIAIGYEDTSIAVNSLRTDREPFSVFARMIE